MKQLKKHISVKYGRNTVFINNLFSTLWVGMQFVCLLARLLKEVLAIFIKFGEWIDYGPQEKCLNFGSEPEYVEYRDDGMCCNELRL